MYTHRRASNPRGWLCKAASFTLLNHQCKTARPGISPFFAVNAQMEVNPVFNIPWSHIRFVCDRDIWNIPMNGLLSLQLVRFSCVCMHVKIQWLIPAETNCWVWLSGGCQQRGLCRQLILHSCIPWSGSFHWLHTQKRIPPQSPLAPNYRLALTGMPQSALNAPQHCYRSKWQRKRKSHVIVFRSLSRQTALFHEWPHKQPITPLSYNTYTLDCLCVGKESTWLFPRILLIASTVPHLTLTMWVTCSVSNDVSATARIPLSAWMVLIWSDPKRH